MVDVIAWPPVGAVGTEWTTDAPLSRSQSVFSGARIVSAFEPVRRLATLKVNALTSVTTSGAGYMEMLKKKLDHGVNLVRLYSYPINRHFDAARVAAWRGAVPLEWTSGGVDLLWYSGGVDLLWFSGHVFSATPIADGGYPGLRLTGLPASTLIARPAEFITVYTETGPEAVQVLREATSDAAGTVDIRTLSAVSGAGMAIIGTRDTAVFEVVGALPRAVQPVAGNWSYTWNFKEVFEDEVPGGFTEVDPWT